MVFADDVPGVDVPHHGELEEMAGLGVHIGARVDQDRVAGEARQGRGDGGPVHAGQHPHDVHADGHRRAGIAGRHERLTLALAHQLGGHPEGRVPLAAERL